MSMTPDAGKAGGATPTNDKANVAHGSNQFNTLEAQAARAGCVLYALPSGGYLLSRWSMVRELPDLRAVSLLLTTMGARA